MDVGCVIDAGLRLHQREWTGDRDRPGGRSVVNDHRHVNEIGLRHGIDEYDGLCKPRGICAQRFARFSRLRTIWQRDKRRIRSGELESIRNNWSIDFGALEFPQQRRRFTEREWLHDRDQ